MRFILASSSPRRREMIASLGIDFEIIKPDIDETQHPGEPPLEYVQRLSREKAQAVAEMVTGQAVVLAADTIVVAADTIGIEKNGELLGKPVDVDDARAMLKRLRARPHTVCTSFTVCRVGEETITDLVCTEVFMRDYSDNEIDAYIATGDPFDKAGSYAIQHPGFHPVEHIEGCYNNVVGLPLCAVKRALSNIRYPGIESPEYCDCPHYQYNLK